jgi:hypothetical protein
MRVEEKIVASTDLQVAVEIKTKSEIRGGWGSHFLVKCERGLHQFILDARIIPNYPPAERRAWMLNTMGG